jgi:riboflavin biosynthesis pyrimidine reductase
MCGPALLSTLSAHGLVDEYMLDVYPIALGDGVRLFGDLPRPIPLSLLGSREFPQGVTLQVYRPQYHSNGSAATRPGHGG